MKHSRGFTLVELLVTISIIGILSSITYYSVGNMRQIARDSKRLADMKQMLTALEFYFNQTNGYPLPPAEFQNNTMHIGDPAHSVLCGVSQGFVDSVTVCENARAPIIMVQVPQSPLQPAAPYAYTVASDQLNNGRPSTYQIAFQLETDFAGFLHGVTYVATPSGIRRK